jgi:endonuclease/exonuclease/phosphatase family metal-dependent hydrolase
MGKVTAVDGQVIQSGQQIGTVGMQGRAQGCELFLKVRNNGTLANPTGWLNYYVGKPAPVGQMYGVSGINLASFNNLGASHTRTGSGSRYATYPSRTVAAYNMLQRMKVDVVGMQEFQEPQSDLFLKTANGAFASFYWTGGTVAKPKRDTENSIVWRTSTMELVSAATYDIPYFNGNTRHMPYVLLRQRSSGREAYFINTHNPASNVFGYGDQSKYRSQALAIQRALVIQLRKTGLPVFLTGDLNDREKAFCPLTAGRLMISANSIPSMTCAMPSQSSIDWVLAAGPARFSLFDYDKYPKEQLISDHPIVRTRVFLTAQTPAQQQPAPAPSAG